ncbi:MAG: 3,4-dihydroxy-2-butanone-4-phosphate synthase [Alphaproteobacteria bacterium]|nr:3,4-dihydroxy-2-butanone-4-phosphate synthase [Alphaproteobacteria bacterium]
MSNTAKKQSTFLALDADPIRRVELAIDDLRDGRMVILVDDEDRENEGDLVMAAEKVTPEAINFMATHARGLICLSMTGEQIERLGLSMMATNNQSLYQTAFTVSIEAREGVTTGISASDRAHTVKVAIDPSATPRSIVTPGHMFPLRARDAGVLERVGQTEGSVDLARLAGLAPAGVICEIMNPDGTMSRMPELLEFGAEHRIRVVTVADVIKYRMRNERVVKRDAESTIEIPGYGTWHTRLYRGVTDDGVHMALWKGHPTRSPALVRVQAAPPPWAFLNPEASQVSQPALRSMAAIHEAGEGAIVFMHCAAPAEFMQHAFRKDFDIDDGKVASAVRADALRDLGMGCQILVDLGMQRLRLLTSSRRPIVGIEAYGLEIVERIPVV